MVKSLFFSIFVSLILVGCSTPSDHNIKNGMGRGAYYTVKEPLQCVPYARKTSGIQIRGDAHTWWQAASTQYDRGSLPKVGAVMVLSQTQRLRYGHLAVVKKIINDRRIEVEHSNWGGDRKTRSVVYKRMPVIDVSINNDWSQAKFYHYPSQTFGSIYPVSGFIYP